jgi:hypothetical protein
MTLAREMESRFIKLRAPKDALTKFWNIEGDDIGDIIRTLPRGD